MNKVLNNSQKEKLEKLFQENRKNVNFDDVKETIDKTEEKINKFNKIPNNLKEVWNDIKDMINLLKDYFNGQYKEVPWGTITAIVVSLLYFVSPVDLIPDFIPIVGYVDDVLVIKIALEVIKNDLNNYRSWRKKYFGLSKTIS